MYFYSFEKCCKLQSLLCDLFTRLIFALCPQRGLEKGEWGFWYAASLACILLKEDLKLEKLVYFSVSKQTIKCRNMHQAADELTDEFQLGNPEM